MPKIKNVCPMGEVDVPLLGRELAAGEEFEVTEEVAALLLAQPDNFIAVTASKKKDN